MNEYHQGTIIHLLERQAVDMMAILKPMCHSEAFLLRVRVIDSLIVTQISVISERTAYLWVIAAHPVYQDSMIRIECRSTELNFFHISLSCNASLTYIPSLVCKCSFLDLADLVPSSSMPALYINSGTSLATSIVTRVRSSPFWLQLKSADLRAELDTISKIIDLQEWQFQHCNKDKELSNVECTVERESFN